MEEEIEQVELIIDNILTDDQLQQLSFYKHHQIDILLLTKQEKLEQDQEKNQSINNLYAQNDTYNQQILELQAQIQKLKLQQQQNLVQIEQLKESALLYLKIRSDEQQKIVQTIQNIKNIKNNSDDLVDSEISFKKKRKQYTQQEKQDILKGFELYNGSELERISGVPQNLLYKWKQVNGVTKKRSGRKKISEPLEQMLIDYITQRRLQKQIITRKDLLFKAEEFVKQNNIQHNLSVGFFTEFLKRNSFSVRKINSKKQKIATYLKVKEFYDDFCLKINSEDYDRNHIINFDETGIKKHPVVERTIALSSEKHVQVIQQESEQVYSLGLSVSMSDQKLTQMIIWPTKGIKKIFKKEIPNNINIQYRDKKSYFNGALFKIWIEEILIKHAKSKPTDKKGILLIDNFKGHNIENLDNILKEIGYEKIFLPPNSTDLLQPLDLLVNKQYKNRYRQLHQEMHGSDNSISHDQFLKLLSLSWEQIDIKNSWNIYLHPNYLQKLQLLLQEDKKEEMDEDTSYESEIIDVNDKSYSEEEEEEEESEDDDF